MQLSVRLPAPANYFYRVILAELTK